MRKGKKTEVRDIKDVNKQKSTLDERKVENQKKQADLIEMKAELIKKEYQDNLKEHLEQKLYDLVYKLKQTERGEKLSIIEIKTMLNQRGLGVNGASPKYSNTELSLIIDYYKQFVTEINKVQRFIPSIPNFCGFAGITTTMYNNWRQSDDKERREIVQRIDDYIADINLTMAQEGEIKEISTIFRAKTEHNYVEAQVPQVVEHKVSTDMQKIIADINAIKAGQSLQTIETEKGEDGVYRPKEE